MTLNRNEKNSARLHRQAELLLKKTKLIKTLTHVGEVRLAGSFAMDLMSNPDIDIHVANPAMTKARALKLLDTLILSNRFRGHLFYDYTIHRHIGFPRGWYVGLKVRANNQKWKIDVWLVKKDQPIPFERQSITVAERRKILALKAERDRREIDLPAWQIYQAVLQKKTNSIKKVTAAGLHWR